MLFGDTCQNRPLTPWETSCTNWLIGQFAQRVKAAFEDANQPLRREFENDVLGYLKVAFGLEFDPVLQAQQVELLLALQDESKIAIKAGHSVGKTYGLGLGVLWWFDCRGCVFTTAPTGYQVNDLLWRYMRQHLQKCLIRYPARPLKTPCMEVSGDAERWAKGRSSDDPTNMQGYHAPRLLVVIDEAGGVPDEMIRVLETMAQGHGSCIAMIGNPNHKRSKFRAAFYEDRAYWHRITMSCWNSCNVLAGREVVPGMVTREWCEEMLATCGEKSAVYLCKVLGEFPPEDATKVIPMEWIEAAFDLWDELEAEGVPEGPLAASAQDCARQGKDSNALTALRGQRIHVVEEWHERNAIKSAGRAFAWIREELPRRHVVDSNAVGGPVCDQLELLFEEFGLDDQVELIGLDWSGAAEQPDRFFRKLDELYWKMRERLNPDREKSERLALKRDDKVAAQLNTRSYSLDERGRIKVETKKDLRKRGAPSPDIADAIVALMEESKEKELFFF